MAFLQAHSCRRRTYLGVEPLDTTVILALIYAVAVTLYFIPSIVAFRRRHPNRWAILGINFLFGATGLGWIGSLIWACGAVHLSPTGNNGGESGLNIFANDPVLVRIEGTTGWAADQSQPYDQLMRLKRLHDAGAISDEEHRGLREPLLDKLTQG